MLYFIRMSKVGKQNKITIALVANTRFDFQSVD